MSGGYGSHKAQILIAVLGLVGVIASGVLSNWDKLVGGSRDNVKIGESANGEIGETNSPVQQNFSAVTESEPMEYMPASFDCEQASTKIEKLICSNTAIGHIDGLLGQAYSRARIGLDNETREKLILEQRRWIEQRDGHIVLVCDQAPLVDVSCVIEFYQSRVEEIEALVD